MKVSEAKRFARTKSVRMLSGRCQRIENGPRGTRDRRALCFCVGLRRDKRASFFVRHGATELDRRRPLRRRHPTSSSPMPAASRPGFSASASRVSRSSPFILRVRCAARSSPPSWRRNRTASASPPIEGLREINHGRWEGKTRAEVEREFPQEYVRYEHDPYSFAPRRWRRRDWRSPLARSPRATGTGRAPHGMRGAGGLAQGHDPAAAQLTARFRSAASTATRLDQSPRRVEHPRFQGCRTRETDALQRHLATTIAPVPEIPRGEVCRRCGIRGKTDSR